MEESIGLGVCGLCGDALKGGDTIVVCPVCNAAHHLECWSRNQGCTAPGCGVAEKQRELDPCRAVRDSYLNVIGLRRDFTSLRDNVASLEIKLDRLARRFAGEGRTAEPTADSGQAVPEPPRVEPQPQSGEREDLLALYNAALQSGDLSALRSQHRMKSVAISVSVKSGVAPATGLTTKLVEGPFGSSLLADDGGRLLLFPKPDVTTLHLPYVEECFDIYRQQPPSERTRLLLAVRQAAVCQATGDGWTLLQKGQIVIDERSESANSRELNGRN